ncbi:MAG: hypothetical protein ACXWQ5_00455 [Ktedonobacterales bacterium]
MYWTEKRAFIACSILVGFAVTSGVSSIVLMVIDTKATDVLALALSVMSAALYVFVIVNARRAEKKKASDA